MWNDEGKRNLLVCVITIQRCTVAVVAQGERTADMSSFAPRLLPSDNLISYAHRFSGGLAAISEVAHAG
jgi:hypothetical protein